MSERQTWRQLLGGINAVVVYLSLCAIFGAASLAASIIDLFWGYEVTIVGFCVPGLFTVLSAVGAYGCRCRKMYAWWLVSAMLVQTAGSFLWRAASALAVDDPDFPVEAHMLGMTGEVFKAACVAWLLLVFWRKKKPEFLVPVRA
ncbi:MAG TPA: hypothetical protein VK163_16360 [Opitutaceae bacterium]|nr:hypothetical protein [Opitutaceae bacterium]